MTVTGDAPAAPASRPAAAPAAGAAGQAAGLTKVLYIGGHSKSGSTLLDRMLGQLPGFVSTGELGYLTTHSIGQNRLCGCGQHFRDCPFWAEVGRTAFGGWEGSRIDELVDLHARVVRHRYVLLSLFPVLAPRYSRDLHRYADLLGELYTAIAEVAGASVVIDSTIDPGRAFVLRHVPGIDLIPLHLVRDSRGAAYSWTKGQVMKDSAELQIARDVQSPPKTAVRWVLYHLMFEILQTVSRRRLLVRYDDVIARPSQTLRRIAAYAGQPVSDEATAFVSDGSVTLPADHTAVGNDMRLQHGAIRLRVDDAWRTRLPRRQRRVVTVLTWPLLKVYGVGGRKAAEPAGSGAGSS